MSRVMIESNPFLDPSKYYFERPAWPAKWISHSDAAADEPVTTLFRLRFRAAERSTARIHVTADERYELWLDGQRIGRGSERGDKVNWFYETYDLDLSADEHVLVARTWWHGAMAPYAQMTVRPGFLVMAEGAWQDALTTGIAPWECKLMEGYTLLMRRQAGHFTSVGASLRIDGSKIPWGWERGDCEAWTNPRVVGPPAVFGHYGEQPPEWVLRPAVLPAMIEQPIRAGVVRHVANITNLDQLEETPVRDADHLPNEKPSWDALIAGKSPVTVPARTMRRVLIDLDEYYCGYPEMITTGGAGAEIHVQWTEALYEQQAEQRGNRQVHRKGNRNEVKDKLFIGFGDTFLPDGGKQRRFDPVWWEAGRYVQIVVVTRDEPVTIESFQIRETRYPLENEGKFEASDGRLTDVAPIMLRGLQMCSHETYMDCPYYEQLMYVGDTRLEVLTTYALTRDTRLPRKAVLMFDLSRRQSGLTMSRYPSRIDQTIAPFSLWWVAMVHDFMMWRDDEEFVLDRVAGVRSVLDVYRRLIGKDGLVLSPPGWNFIDWVPGWNAGIPPEGHKGPNCSINLLLAYAMKLGAEIELLAGETKMSARNRVAADRLIAAINRSFWSEEREIYSEDIGHNHYSEHAQCLALLAGAVPEDRRERLVDGLLNAKDLYRTTIFFTHYLFEAYRLIGRIDRLLERMGLWFELKALGLKTTIETPEPARSDCHAWGAHPLFHYHATILGVRPEQVGFERVRITPQLGPLQWARGTVPHPRGLIDVNVQRDGSTLRAQVTLPPGVAGTLILNGQEHEIGAGSTSFSA